ncbi:MAG TPA: CBS domain-containing protein [Candidatus Limnocylindrales bacterium]|jgi:CBS domain-containing protein|nr:CBS domain-containing protein [Candidatus Limnocylindrales bacterium]
MRPPSAFDRLVGDYMSLPAVVVAVDDLVERAETLLVEHHVSGLPVVDATGAIVGVVSRTDILGESPRVSALVRGHADRLLVGELMSSPAITVSITTTLREAARVMRDARIHRVVVVDEAARPVGVLSASDYVAIAADE